METFSLPQVIHHQDDLPPRLINWKNDKYLVISGEGTEISSSGYHYHWRTARASVTVFRGSWYFEVTLKSKGSCRIGWCTDKFSGDDVLGGDDFSWVIDGTQQKKYHKSTGTTYGEPWTRGDVIGSHLDFEQRRISYYKNGRPLGVAFGSLRLAQTGLMPAISVSPDAKVSVNFGRNFGFSPPGCFGFFSVVGAREKKMLEEVYCIYGNKDEEEDVIEGASLVQLAQDLGSTGPTDITLLLLAWVLFSSHQWQFTKQEWFCSWSLQGVYTMESIKQSMDGWRRAIHENEDIFRNFYQFVFEYLKQPKTTNIDKHEAIMAWKMLGLEKKWVIFDRWEKFWMERVNVKVVTRDTWNMLLKFIEKMGDSVENYDENDSWPLALDEFVKEVMKKEC